jgi:hypothetical protein
MTGTVSYTGSALNAQNGAVRLARGATVIGATETGITTSSSVTITQVEGAIVIDNLDFPNSTSQQTYTVQGKIINAGAGTLSYPLSTDGPSTIILEEMQI